MKISKIPDFYESSFARLTQKILYKAKKLNIFYAWDFVQYSKLDAGYRYIILFSPLDSLKTVAWQSQLWFISHAKDTMEILNLVTVHMEEYQGEFLINGKSCCD